MQSSQRIAEPAISSDRCQKRIYHYRRAAREEVPASQSRTGEQNTGDAEFGVQGSKHRPVIVTQSRYSISRRDLAPPRDVFPGPVGGATPAERHCPIDSSESPGRG